LCAWFAICSNTRKRSAGIWNSTTGRDPAIAAPVAKLVNACSEIGMSMIRSGPNRLSNPVVTLLTAMPMSSPNTHTAGSRSISADSARLSARTYDRMGIRPFLPARAARRRRDSRARGGSGCGLAREGDRLVEQRFDLAAIRSPAGSSFAPVGTRSLAPAPRLLD
jgi:hypothetical protein